jgi:hypothetical protein
MPCGYSVMVSIAALSASRQQRRTKQLEQLECDLQELYQYETEVLVADCNLFDTAIKDLLTMQLGDITKWIFSRKPIILQSCQDTNRRNCNHMRLLPKYFHPLACRRKAHKPRPMQDTSKMPITLITAPLITEYFRCAETPLLCRCCLIPSTHLMTCPHLTQQSIQFPDDVI